MPLDPIKLKYADLKVSDPAAAEAFAKAHGIQTEGLSPADQLKAGSLQGIRKMIGAEVPAAAVANTKPGMLPSTRIEQKPMDMFDNVIEAERDATGNPIHTREARMEAMQKALQQWSAKRRGEAAQRLPAAVEAPLKPSDLEEQPPVGEVYSATEEDEEINPKRRK
jgi:hypothetical protein